MAAGNAYLRIGYLALTCLAAQLGDGFGYMRELAEVIAREKTAACIDRYAAARPDPLTHHEIAALSFFAPAIILDLEQNLGRETIIEAGEIDIVDGNICLLYTSDAADDLLCVDL